MANNIIEIRADAKAPADMNKCKLFFGDTEIVNIRPMKLFNDHGRLILKAEIHFAKSFLKDDSETSSTETSNSESKKTKKGEAAE